MRKQSDPHTFSQNLTTRQRQIEAELALMTDEPKRQLLAQQLRELEAARQMEGWLRTGVR